MLRTTASAVALTAVLAWATPARAQDAGISFLYVGLPILDATIFVGGVAAAIGGTVSLVDGQASPGWSAMNYAFGGLNVASVLGYGISMGVVSGLWPFLIWPALTHAGLAIANFVIGARLTAPPPRAARVAVLPFAGVDRGTSYGGLALRVVHF